MGLRFAIVKDFVAKVGDWDECIVFEHDQDWIKTRILQYMLDYLPWGKLFRRKKWSEAEIIEAFEEAFNDVVEEHKRVTLRIF